MKRTCLLLFLLITILLSGCAGNGSHEYVASYDGETEEVRSFIHISSVFKTDYAFMEPDKEEIDRFLQTYESLMETFGDRLLPLMSDEELAAIEWDEDIRPYMEYDWLEDEHISEYHTFDTCWTMTLVDLNMDGQREMLVSHWYYRDDDPICVYTVRDGEVVYCGLVMGEETRKSVLNEYIDYWPAYSMDIYRNGDGTFRYLSGESDEHQESGEYDIYESTFDGTQITCRPLYAALCSHDGTYGERKWQYLSEGTDWNRAECADESLSELNGMMAEYMQGYEKVTPVFLESDYAVPGCVDILPEKQREIVRANILAGFACAVESAVYDSEAVAVLGEKYDGFVNRYPEEELPWNGITVDNRMTTVKAGGHLRDIIFHPYEDIMPYTTNFKLVNGKLLEENLYIVFIDLDTPRYCTSRGVRVGMTKEELQAAYDNLESKDRAELGTNYYYTNGSLHITFSVKEGEIYHIRLSRPDLIDENDEK